MTAARDMLVELSDEQTGMHAVCDAHGVWMDVLYTLSDASYQLRALGELRQAEAMRIDAESMARRAKLHLRCITVRERERLAALQAQPANDNGQEQDKQGTA